MNPTALTDEERAYLLDHLDLHEFSPVVPSSVHRACVDRGLIEDVRPGWYRVRSGMRRALRASLAPTVNPRRASEEAR